MSDDVSTQAPEQEPAVPEALSQEAEDVLEDAVAFAGVSKYPARVKCALLGWMAWKDATARALAKDGEK